MTATRAVLCAVLALLALPATAAEPAPLRVLFVGNSYTYTNDLPLVVAQVAAARGILIVPTMLAEPDFALEDHIVTGLYDSVLESDPYDWVVLQQGPSSLPQNQVYLRTWAVRAAASAHAHGIRVALMAAWPALDNAYTSLNAELSYRNAAIASGGCSLPVATAWRLVREQRPDLSLYQRDRLHPTPEGTLLAALVIVRGMLYQAPNSGAPDLENILEDAGWRAALREAPALDAIAMRTVWAEPARCQFAH